MQIVKNFPAKEFQNLEQRLVWMDYNLGRIDYNLIRMPPLYKSMKINVFIPTI